MLGLQRPDEPEAPGEVVQRRLLALELVDSRHEYLHLGQEAFVDDQQVALKVNRRSVVTFASGAGGGIGLEDERWGTIEVARDGGAVDIAVLVLYNLDDAALLEVLHVGVCRANLGDVVIQDDAPAQKVGHARAVCAPRTGR